MFRVRRGDNDGWGARSQVWVGFAPADEVENEVIPRGLFEGFHRARTMLGTGRV